MYCGGFLSNKKNCAVQTYHRHAYVILCPVLKFESSELGFPSTSRSVYAYLSVPI